MATGSSEAHVVDGLLVTRVSNEIAAFNVDSGSVVWTNADFYQPAATADETVFACGEEESGLVALNSATGLEKWSIDDAPCGYIATIGDVLISVGNDPLTDGGSQLLVAQLSSGEVVVQRVIDDGIDDQVDGFAGVAASEDLVLVAGYQSNAIVLDAAGSELDRFRVALGRPLSFDGNIAILDRGESIGAYDFGSREWLWDRADAHAGSGSIGAGQIALGSDGGVDLVDLRDGSVVWTATIGRARTVRTTMSEGVVIATTELFAAAFDRATGQLLWWTVLPKRTSAVFPAVSEDDAAEGLSDEAKKVDQFED